MKEKRYSEKFKQRMIQRLVGPNRVTASALSKEKEVGVCQPTLSLWLRKTGSVGVVKDEKVGTPARRPEHWTPKETLEAVLEAEGMADSGVWLRPKALKGQHLREWRAALALKEGVQAVFAPYSHKKRLVRPALRARLEQRFTDVDTAN